MGVENFYYKNFIKTVNEHFTEKKKRKVLCLGYPDCLVDSHTLVEIYGPEFIQKIPEDPKANEIRAWHKKSSLPRIYDMLYLLRHHDFEPTIFDSINHRGFEVIVDLNEPLPADYLEQFDLVIDTGTLEHCFNVGTAFKNVCQSIKKDGVFMTAAPITKLNHGYWNFGTIVHKDGFEWNGFEILDQSFYKNGVQVSDTEINKKRIPLLIVGTAIAKRKEIKDWTWPIQRKYLK